MPEQEQKRVQKKDGGESGDAGQVESSAKGEKLKEEMGEILDEIDSVLEENAEEFVKSYVQKGGEGPIQPPAFQVPAIPWEPIPVSPTS